MSEPTTAAVQLRGVWLRLGRDAVLRDLNLDVAAGEGLALLGENGAGKTTLLRVLAGALSATRGAGRVYGYDLRDRRSVRDQVHFLTHDSGLYPDLTPRENLLFSVQMHGLGEARAADIDATLNRVGLERAASRRVRFLSAGQRKRTQLARLALLRRPLTLVDEPFANLDAAGRELALALLGETRAAGCTLIVAAHEPELALQVAPRAVTLAGGQLSG